MASYDLESKNGMLLLADDGVSLRPGGCCCGPPPPECCGVEILVWQVSSGYDPTVVWSGSHYGTLSVKTCPSNITCVEDLFSAYAACGMSLTCGTRCGSAIVASKYGSGSSTGWKIDIKYKKGSGTLKLATFQYVDTRTPGESTFETYVTTSVHITYGDGEPNKGRRPVVTVASTKGGDFNGMKFTERIVANGSDKSETIAMQTCEYLKWGGSFSTAITIE